MSKKSLQSQVFYRLSSRKAYGHSKHEDKLKLHEELGGDYRPWMTPWKIYSYGTFQSYLKASTRFVKWCMKQGISETFWLNDIRHLVEPYLQSRLGAGLSIWTLKMERSALGMLYKEHINFALPERSPDNIHRSRKSAKMDNHFSLKRNHVLVTLARSTGSRRKDLGKLKPENFEERNGRLYVRFHGSKGGRNRISVVFPSFEKEVREILAQAKAEGREHERFFEHVHSKADIHGFRRIYAQELYKAVSTDPDLRNELLRLYPARVEYGKKGKKIQSEYYHTRCRGVNRTFRRDDVYIVTQSLGHTRLEVAITHYLI